MIFWKDCVWCDGEGRTHSPGRTGDPDDDGVTCDRCEGAGGSDVEVDEEGDDV